MKELKYKTFTLKIDKDKNKYYFYLYESEENRFNVGIEAKDLDSAYDLYIQFIKDSYINKTYMRAIKWMKKHTKS